MESDIARAVGQALFPKLSVFHGLDGKSLRGAWYAEEDGCLGEVILDFGLVSLVVKAIPDDDSIDFDIVETDDLPATSREDVSERAFWKEWIGQPFGWGWITVNQQGYCDGLLLSLGGIVPQILMNVMASSISLLRISP